MSTPPIVFDLETHDIPERYDLPGDFARIAGYHSSGHLGITTNTEAVARVVACSAAVGGHNIISFDLPVLQAQHPSAGIDILGMTRRRQVWDSLIAESVLNPPKYDDRAGAVGRYMATLGLDATCQRYGLPGKSQDGKALAKEHGGWGRIPLDDPTFLDYLRGDVTATRGLIATQYPHHSDYLFREHRVHALGSVMTQAGLLLDETLCRERHMEGQRRRQELTDWLVREHGLPTVKADGKPAASPHMTKEGKLAIIRAFESLGVPEEKLPHTPKLAVSFNHQALTAFTDTLGDKKVSELAEVVTDLNGVRTVYGTNLNNVHTDGRVHPKNLPFQASGRWSVVDPGLTVMGKRGGRVHERDIILASEGMCLVALDFSQVDMRAIAAHSQDHTYIDILSDPSRDLHSEVAAALWGGPRFGNPKRETAKACGHGWNYGMGVEKLAVTAKISEEEALRFDTAMCDMFPTLVRWRDEVRETAKGSPLDNGFGRKMACDPTRAYTQGPALMGQGTTRDLVMEGMLRLPDDIARMLRLFIHDETVLEVPVENRDEIVVIVEAAYTFDWAPPGASRAVPIRCDISAFGETWAQCYEKGAMT